MEEKEEEAALTSKTNKKRAFVRELMLKKAPSVRETLGKAPSVRESLGKASSVRESMLKKAPSVRESVGKTSCVKDKTFSITEAFAEVKSCGASNPYFSCWSIPPSFSCLSLTHVDLHGCDDLKCSHVETLARRARRLTHIDLSCTGIGDGAGSALGR